MQTLGTLSDSTLGDILGRCLRARVDGTIELEGTEARRSIHLRRGLVCAVEGAPPRFGALVESEALACAEEIERVLDDDRSPRRVGQKLVAARILSARSREALLERQRALRLEALFLAAEGSLTLYATRPLPAGAAELQPMTARVLLGRPRARNRRSPRDPSLTAAIRSLGLDDDATPHAIRERYRALVLSLHPDRGARTTEHQRRLREVLDAWRTITRASIHSVMDQ